MDYIEQEKATNKFFDMMSEIGEMTNKFEQMAAYAKIGEFLNEIYKQGYDNGFSEGKKLRVVNLNQN